MFHVQYTLPYVIFDTAKQNCDKTRETLGLLLLFVAFCYKCKEEDWCEYS